MHTNKEYAAALCLTCGHWSWNTMAGMFTRIVPSFPDIISILQFSLYFLEFSADF
jgi:hypothetical protein